MEYLKSHAKRKKEVLDPDIRKIGLNIQTQVRLDNLIGFGGLMQEKRLPEGVVFYNTFPSTNSMSF